MLYNMLIMYRNNEVHYLDRPVAVVSNPHSTGAGGGKKAEEIAEFLGGSLGGTASI